jgi:phage FluMu gp28-like protein
MSLPVGGYPEAEFAEPGDVPAILLPYQAEAVRLSHEHQLFVEEKSRRTGMTYGFAADSVLTAGASRASGGMDVFYIAYNLDMTREFIDYCGEFAKAFDQLASAASEFLFDDGSDEGIKAFRIDFPSGFSIVALSSKPRSLRGKQGRVIIDEAAFHDQLEELLKAALALLMWGGSVIVISTHDGADNPFNSLIEDIRAGKRKGHVHRTTLKDALEQGLYKRICLRTGRTWSREAEAAWEADLRATYGDAAEEELDVIPARGSGTYLPRATIERAMREDLPVIRLRCPDGFEREEDAYRQDFIREFLELEVAPWLRDFDRSRRTFLGQDFARTGDVSPMAFGQHDEHMRLIARYILELRNVPFREQEFILNWQLERVPLFSNGKMDARGNGSALAEAAQQRWGFDRIEAVMATEKTYLAFMPKLRAGIEDGTFLIPKDEGTLEDLRMIKLVRGVPKIPDRSVMSKADGAKGQRHGDNAIALMHLRAAADEDLGPLDFHSAGARSAAESATITSTGFGTITRGRNTGGFHV